MRAAIMMLFTRMMEYLNGDNIADSLSRGLQEYMVDAYEIAGVIQQTIIAPVAFSILAIFILFEFQKISLKVENAGGAPTLGFEMIMKAFVKFIICYIVILRIQVILDAIVALGSMLAGQIMDYNRNDLLGSYYNVVDSVVRSLSWWEVMVVLMVFVVLFLVSLVVGVFINVIVYVRFFELYIFSAIAPISMAALPNQEFSSMAKGFFKNFAASSLHAVMIALVLTIYPVIFMNFLSNHNQTMWGLIFGLTIYMIALMFAINKTKGWAKMIVSAS
ncbi:MULTISPECIES: hypothetical protein [Enterococcus]|uniref:hypothetical protein n=1 Tax=Enterococcus TaxID=1350 RepID=UPI0002F1F6EC|nr:hypothetical protein [Enterococcus mundtii]MBO1085433.1 hypothetical protein [Enterococcus mundtii]MDB7101395.1 hypothetical protein [Enterococcus mundtii]MDV7746241.1 hypothetical protein [Enterococcus mundtii]